ncbi:hypothetical protein SCLCIDRAFT_1224593 [Scleroderma citrinum Foug A]|uniref:Uncharacterized protein n=1 Tax=Scleroderma citrinum Foug A TaxID=1036808 RepID=A0A0C3D4M8_9AGAM|nr:hypothetical protein SCLCIDRAFT_1224593 [Scleroderma citrinum Foug A]
MPRLAAPCGDVGDKDGRLPQGVKVQRFPLKAGTAAFGSRVAGEVERHGRTK